ncbi:MAG: nucleoside-diphosphate sugar epimerase [Planctomycetales bacterium 4484_123]|nr:MAG: nucleoside-diphosphate sugar epimerase [Planctomycetales bacterium 4484_123]
MRFLITGGAGFIGSHLAEALLARGHDVTVVDDLSTGSLTNIQHLMGGEGFQFVRESVRNSSTMAVLVQQCDVIFHLAAAVGVQLIVERPVHTIETNIHGTEVVLRLANKFGRRVFIASTSEVYGKSTKVPFGENDDSLLGSTRYTRWSYACSKMVDEFLALAYHDQYGLQTTVGRLFNTVGPRQTGTYGMVVPRFIRAALRGEPLTVYGTGEQSRCFCHVADVVRAVIGLIECPAAVGEVVNIGSDESVTINELAEKIVALTGSASEIRHISYEEAYGRPFDDMLIRKPDLTKIGRLIGFKPRYSLQETLGEIIEYERRLLG